MNILASIQLGLVATQAAMNLVQLVEGPGNGPQKKEIVKGLALVAINTAFQLAYGKSMTEDLAKQIYGAVDGTVDGVVELFNSTGTFTHQIVPIIVPAAEAPPDLRATGPSVQDNPVVG